MFKPPGYQAPRAVARLPLTTAFQLLVEWGAVAEVPDYIGVGAPQSLQEACDVVATLLAHQLIDDEDVQLGVAQWLLYQKGVAVPLSYCHLARW